MKEWILKHRFWMTFALIAGAFIFIGLITVLSCYLSHESVKVIEALYYSSQIVASIFVISGVIIGVWQYYLSYVDSRRNLDIVRVQKAIELAEYYKDNILCSLAPLRYIYANSLLEIYENESISVKSRLILFLRTKHIRKPFTFSL